ncbi:ankyrin and armadillo repeat-containing protein [Biomphalaria glabrata]|nr:ankyrin and armadillo repeat-containing protein-like; partial [Biomphalaria glabrata]
MAEPEENGWEQVHLCASRGFLKSLERCLESDPNLLELETADGLRQTPFLLAVGSGDQDIVDFLVKRNAKVNVVNSQNNGAVEICAIKGYVSLLKYLATLNLPDLPVYDRLLKMLVSDTEEEVEAAGKCLATMTEKLEDVSGGSVINPEWQYLYDNGGVSAIVKVAKNTIQDEFKIPAIQTLLNIIEKQEVQDQFVSSGGMPVFIYLLKSQILEVVELSCQVIRDLAVNKHFAELLVQNQAVTNILRILQSFEEPEVLVFAVQAIRNIAQSSTKLCSTLGSTQGLITALVHLFDCNDSHLLLALTQAVSCLAEGDNSNQTAFVKEGVSKHIKNLLITHGRYREIQHSLIEAIHKLSNGNQQAQLDLKSHGIVKLLIQLLKKKRVEALLEKTAMALWSLAGERNDEKREMANYIDVPMLIEFLNSNTANINFIGSEGLGVLAQGPINKQSEIGKANGIPSVVRLLKSPHEFIVLSSVRTVRNLCVSVANVPHHNNQNSVLQSQGIRFLLALLVHSANEVIQVEAAYTLGCVSMGNKQILKEISKHSDFSFVRILRLLYSNQPIVRLLAGSALSSFAYNNFTQQKEIAQQGGVRFSCFIPFLQSDDEFYRCHAAYQTVVLARIIPDEEQAKSSAVGIKLLVDLLQDSEVPAIQSLTADFVASLCHSRAGIPAAIIAINGVDYLCNLLHSNTQEVKGTAAIALGYLSHDPVGQRKILHRCRNDPYLMRKILFYNREFHLASTFKEGWQHYRKIGLPPIQSDRTNLVQAKLEDTGSFIPASSSNLHDEGPMSRLSTTFNRRDSLYNSHLSIVSQRSPTPLASLVQIEEVK